MAERRRGYLGSVLAVSILAALLGGSAGASNVEGDIDKQDTYQIARLTGPNSINRTDLKWNVHGTDLGHTFMHRGEMYMAFGDTFGPNGSDWRSSALAKMRDADPTDGLTFNAMITDRPGHAKELIHDDDVPGDEVTVIPTNGVSDDRRIYLHYMAVREWGPPGQWWLNRSGIAYSDDDGQTWTVSDVWWPGESNFGQVAFVEEGAYVYMFGIPGGRFGGAKLARVPRDSILDKGSYRYWSGSGWSPQEAEASTVVPAPVGELSVRWNAHYRKWLMLYLNDDDAVNAVVLRTAECLGGPWSEERVVVTAEEVPQLYAPYMPPRWNSGKDIYFTLSRFNFYNVFWWHTSLEGEPKGSGRCTTP